MRDILRLFRSGRIHAQRRLVRRFAEVNKVSVGAAFVSYT